MNYTQSLPLLIIATIFFQNNSPVNNPLQGSIAYVRDEKEIRIIQPDGSGDHELWTHNDAKPYSGIGDLAWSPDGKSLAFSSGHASATSLFHSDLYLIKSDGSGLRKLTNPPTQRAIQTILKGKYPLFEMILILFKHRMPQPELFLCTSQVQILRNLSPFHQVHPKH